MSECVNCSITCISLNILQQEIKITLSLKIIIIIIINRRLVQLFKFYFASSENLIIPLFSLQTTGKLHCITLHNNQEILHN